MCTLGIYQDLEITQLSVASMEGNPAIAKMLIQHGADANKKDKEGKTVLMVSVCNRQLSCKLKHGMHICVV